MVEYLQQLQDKVLEKEVTLLEGAEESQVTGSKCKKVAARDKEGKWLSKKAREKYHGGAIVKMEGANPCEKYVSAGQDYLVYPSRWVFLLYLLLFFFNNFLLHSQSLAYAGCIALK